MIEFKNFILRHNNLKMEWVGSKRIYIGDIEFTIAFNKKTKVSVCGNPDNGSLPRKLLQLVRFHLCSRDSCRIVTSLNANNPHQGDCKRAKCFQKMVDAFPEEWAIFNGYSQTEKETATQKLNQSTPSANNVQQNVYVSSGGERSQNSEKCEGSCMLDIMRDFTHNLNSFANQGEFVSERAQQKLASMHPDKTSDV